MRAERGGAVRRGAAATLALLASAGLVMRAEAVLVKPSAPLRGWNSFDFGDGSERPYNTPDVPTLRPLKTDESLTSDDAGAPPPPPQKGPWFSQPFVSGVGGYHSYRIPAMVTLPRKTTTGEPELLAFCEGRKLNCDDVDWNDIVMRRSTDGGTRPCRLPCPQSNHLTRIVAAVQVGRGVARRSCTARAPARSTSASATLLR